MMNGILKTFKFWSCVTVISLVAGLLVLVVIFNDSAKSAKAKVSRLQSDNDLQALVIAKRAFTFQQLNEIAAAADERRQIITVESEKRVVIYREKLVRNKAADELIDNSVACGVLEYANRLRSSAVRGASEDANYSDNGATTSCKLTYRQAVLWIDLLLSRLEEANAKLSAIRKADNIRAENK